MQSVEQTRRWTETEPLRVEAIVESLASLQEGGESLTAVAHEARNMVTALGLYCELLEEPGVLAPSCQHYARELKLVAATSRRLVERLSVLQSLNGGDAQGTASARKDAECLSWVKAIRNQRRGTRHWELLPALPIPDLADELRSSRNLLAALAGSSISLTMDVHEGGLPVRITGEDLTRVLVNLVKNAVEAMPNGGRIHFGLREIPSAPNAERWLALTIEDSGPGIPAWAIEQVFDAGYTTRAGTGSGHSEHRGLGLAITRSIVEGAGGRIHAANRDPSGACFQIELPAREC